MTTTLASRVRAALALTVAVMLATALLPGPGAQAQEPDVTEYEGEVGTIVERSGDGLLPSFRYRGAARHDTAGLIATDAQTFQADSADAFAASDEVIVARADDFPDSLAGAALAGAFTAPVLLVDTAGDIQADTRAALDTIEPSTVFALGGTAAISEQVATDLADLSYVDDVERIAGDDRYDTAAAVARAADAAEPVPELGGDTTALLATGEQFPDALAGGQVAYAGPFPLLLTPGDELGEAAEQALADLGVDRVVVLGGPAAVADEVVGSLEGLDYAVDRLAGRDRTVTAVEVAQFAVDELGFTADHLNVARGDAFADALAIGPHAGEEQSPLLISATATALGQPEVATFHSDRSCTLDTVHVAGGFSAVSPELEQEIRGAATGAACSVEVVTGEQTVEPGEEVDIEADVLTSLGESSTAGVDVHFATDAQLVGDDEAACAPETAQTGAQGRASCTFATEAEGAYTVTATVTTDEGDEVSDDVSVVVGDLDPASLPDAGEGLDSFELQVSSAREVGQGHEPSPNPLGPAGGNAQGVAQVTVDPVGGEVCLSFVAVGVGGDFAAFEEAQGAVPVHVHEGAFDVNGDVVVGFADHPTQLASLAVLQEACQSVDDAGLLADMVANPNDYYVNAHTDLWPGGNIRGQLGGDWDGEDRTDDEPAEADSGGLDLPLL